MLPDFKLEFMHKMKQASEAVCKQFGIPPQVCTAQAILETGWGVSNAVRHHNYFGIKGEGDAGSVKSLTKEYRGTKENGYLETIEDKFAVYSSMTAGVEAYCQFLLKSRYAKATELFKDKPAHFITYVWGCGYATDIEYPNKIVNIMKRIYSETKDASYNVNIDERLSSVIKELQAVPAGSARRELTDKLLSRMVEKTNSANLITWLFSKIQFLFERQK